VEPRAAGRPGEAAAPWLRWAGRSRWAGQGANLSRCRQLESAILFMLIASRIEWGSTSDSEQRISQLVGQLEHDSDGAELLRDGCSCAICRRSNDGLSSDEDVGLGINQLPGDAPASHATVRCPLHQIQIMQWSVNRSPNGWTAE
jgi:hypothetical protein